MSLGSSKGQDWKWLVLPLLKFHQKGSVTVTPIFKGGLELQSLAGLGISPRAFVILLVEEVKRF